MNIHEASKALIEQFSVKALRNDARGREYENEEQRARTLSSQLYRAARRLDKHADWCKAQAGGHRRTRDRLLKLMEYVERESAMTRPEPDLASLMQAELTKIEEGK